MIKILMVGVCDKPESTNTFQVKAFRALGHRVDCYNYRTELEKLKSDVRSLQWHFMSSLRGKRYDLILFCKVNQLLPLTLNSAKAFGKVAYWFPDPMSTAKAMSAQEYARFSNIVFATMSKTVEHFREVNDNVYHVIEGFDPDMYYPVDLLEIYDTTFIGNCTDKRYNIINAISQSYPVHVFGNDWPKSGSYFLHNPVYNEQYRSVVAQSKICLSFHHGHGLSDRIVVTMACGGLMLAEMSEDLILWFDRGKHLDAAVDIKGMLDKIGYWLANDERRNQIAANAAKHVRKNYTWEMQCKKVLDAI